MTLNRLVITAVVTENRPVPEVAEQYGVSRSWLYALLARYRVEGEAAFEPRSRRPKTVPTVIPPRRSSWSSSCDRSWPCPNSMPAGTRSAGTWNTTTGSRSPAPRAPATSPSRHGSSRNRRSTRSRPTSGSPQPYRTSAGSPTPLTSGSPALTDSLTDPVASNPYLQRLTVDVVKPRLGTV